MHTSTSTGNVGVSPRASSKDVAPRKHVGSLRGKMRALGLTSLRAGTDSSSEPSLHDAAVPHRPHLNTPTSRLRDVTFSVTLRGAAVAAAGARPRRPQSAAPRCTSSALRREAGTSVRPRAPAFPPSVPDHDATVSGGARGAAKCSAERAPLTPNAHGPPTAGALAPDLDSPLCEDHPDGRTLLRSIAFADSFSFNSAAQRWEASAEVMARVWRFVAALALDHDLTVGLVAAGDGARRWIAEQEYFLGTALLVCQTPQQPSEAGSFDAGVDDSGSAALRPAAAKYIERMRVLANARTPPLRSAPSQGGSFLLVADEHPVLSVAHLVLRQFPQWGNWRAFAALWNTQARIVMDVADAAHQLVIHPPPSSAAIYFDSQMECGNLLRAERATVHGVTVFLLWLEGDCQTDRRLWFRFSVRGCQRHEPLRMRIMNLTPHSKLYRNGMRPVWRSGGQPRAAWRPVQDVSYCESNDEGAANLSFDLVPQHDDEALEIAFCIPYGYSDLLCHIIRWHALVKKSPESIRFEERVLCRTLDGRKLHLLIITSQSETPGASRQLVNDTTPQQVAARPESGFSMVHSHPHRIADFSEGKKVVLVSSRVHPGEVTASHAVHGMVQFLLSADPRAAALREHFIFFVVPMLNPDGVARGHVRFDQNGVNLNRCYASPSEKLQPTVHALRGVFDHLLGNYGERFAVYLDFHAHASQTNGFLYGNHLQASVQTWNLLYSKLVSMHTRFFDHTLSRFGKADMVSKNGTSRVLFGKSIVHSYTIELTHFTTGKLREVDHGSILDDSASVGEACALALLDLCQIQESSALRAAGGLVKVAQQVRHDARGTSSISHHHHLHHK